MIESNLEICASNFENALFQLIRKAVRTEIQEIVKKEEDRLLTIDQVAQRRDWTSHTRHQSTANSRTVTNNFAPARI